jgi:cytochrome c2
VKTLACVESSLAALALALLVSPLSCKPGVAPALVGGGDATRGRALIAGYQCGACHEIPGVRGARGTVGPPLVRFGLRSYIGGRAPNTPANLIRWLQDPKTIDPGTAMPDMGVDEPQARDIAAYLYGLR